MRFFFFYGTLIAGSGNDAAARVHERLRDLGPASTRGRLYAIADIQGWYPALVAGDEVVTGRLYETLPAFDDRDLARLDAWEDFHPLRPEASLYLREEIAVVAPAGSCRAWAYRFNQPVPHDACAIDRGDFRAWLAREGSRAFGERL